MNYKNNTIKKPLYTYLKSHRCLKCGSLTRVDKIRKTINTNSKEFKAYAYKFFDSYPIGEVEFIEDGFFCKNCDFHIPITSYYRLEKMTDRLERKENHNKNIYYLYEEGLSYTFSRNWCCNDCNTKMSLGYELIKNKSNKESFFKSFTIHTNSEESEYRKLYLMCKNCDNKTILNEVEENINVKKCKLRKGNIRILQILVICIAILLFFLIKGC